MQSLKNMLVQGIQQLNISVSEQSLCQLMQYLNLLQKWNKVYNLTAIRQIEKMVSYHLLDSLSIAPYILGQRVLDLGSGAGLPGIPLAILQVDKQFTLLDSNGKKTRFINQAVAELGLNNVQIQHCRIEQYHTDEAFDSIVSRAYSTIESFILACQSVAAQHTDFLAMKGMLPEAEIQDLPQAFKHHVIQLQVPGVDSQRHLIIINRISS